MKTVMDKAPDAYRTISEVGEDLDLPQHVLRFWETRFGQIKPLKRGGGRRYYRPDDVELLKGIRHLLYKEGYTIKGVQRILKEQGVKAVQAFVRESLSGGLLDAPAQSSHQPSPPPRPEPFLHIPGPSSRAFEEAVPEREQAGFSEAGMARAERPLQDFEPPFLNADVDDAALAPVFIEPAIPEQPVMRMPDGPAPSGHIPSGQVPAPAGQVSMFRGGLQRGEGGAHTAPMAEFANQIRERVEHPHARADLSAATPAIGSREALLMALDELIACRAAIDQVLAGRQE